MATPDELRPLIEHQKNLVGDLEQSEIEKQKECHETNGNTAHRENENTLWSRKRSVILNQTCCTKVRSKFKHNLCCLWASKAVLLILLWNLTISICFESFLDPTLYTDIFGLYAQPSMDDTLNGAWIFMLISGLPYGFSALLFVFYPLAGFLADVRWGRYTTVKKSLCFLSLSMLIMIFLVGLALLGLVPMFIRGKNGFDTNDSKIFTVSINSMLCVIFGLPVFLGVILVLCSIVAFSANVIQFGLDQLHDAPAETLTLYIHWYLWTSQVGPFLIGLPTIVSSISILDFSNARPIVYANYIIPLFLGSAIAFLPITLCWERCMRHWFLIEPGSTNPYKLVHTVIRFAKDHTNPVRRSAFTYCEDELPSRLDLGKEKYGGPFTTEEVENVKAFLGILRVLLSIGPIFFVEFAFIDNLPSLGNVGSLFDCNSSNNYNIFDRFCGSGCFTPMLILVLIPLYLGLLKPFIRGYIPGMLKRMGLGMILLLLSGLCTLVIGIAGRNYKDYCWLRFYPIYPKRLIIQFILNAISYLLLYISAFEFICAQSPHSMKGLLIGTFFATKGVFKLVSVVLVYIPIGVKCSWDFSGCGFMYYLINVVVVLIGIVIFAIIAKGYEYRKRDEPDNIYRYAEEYYANAQDEPNYDYDEYDNLNVETIRN
jgi:peptide/histidine transporter 3/4